MSTIPGTQFNITGASGTQGLLGPRDSWKTYVFPRGAWASQASSGTLLTFDTAAIAGRFAVNNWIQAGLGTANLRQVAAVGGNSISISGAALTVAQNDRIFIIGSTQPTVSGGSATYTIPATQIRQRDDDAATLYTNSMVTANTDGLVRFYTTQGLYDCLIQDGNQSNQGYIADLPVGLAEGVSTTLVGVFGSTVTFNAAIGVTGTASFGSTVTISANLIPGTDATYSIGSPTLRWKDESLSGTGIFPRIGQSSTATTGGALRIVEGVQFPLTAAGIIAAMAEVSAAGGGTVLLPAAQTINIGATTITVPSRVELNSYGGATSSAGSGSVAGYGCSLYGTANPLVRVGSDSANQGFSLVRNLTLIGTATSGLIGTQVGLLVQGAESFDIFENLVISNVATGVKILGNRSGQQHIHLIFRNVTVTSWGTNGFIQSTSGGGVSTDDLHCENVRVQAEFAAASGNCFSLTNIRESTFVNCRATSTNVAVGGIVLNTTQSLAWIGGLVESSATATNSLYGLDMQAGADATFTGAKFNNTLSNNSVDFVHQVTSGTRLTMEGCYFAFDTGVRYAFNVTAGNFHSNGGTLSAQSATGATVSTIYGGNSLNTIISNLGAFNLNSMIGNSANDTTPDVSGVAQNGIMTVRQTVPTTITNLRNAYRGQIVNLIFGDTYTTITDGGNFALASNFISTADDALTLAWTGTTWTEMNRSVN